jgi:hypothetical protein
MKLEIFLLVLAGMLVPASSVSAQMVKQPGQLAGPLRPRLQNESTTGTSGLVPQTTIAQVDTSPRDRFVNRLWIASIFTSVAATAVDAATSWGKVEGNGLLASSNGTFGARGVAIKAGLEAVSIVPQICMRKHKDMKGIFAMVNLGEAGIFAGIAVHNLDVPKPASH